MIAGDDPRLAGFRDILAEGEPICGRLHPDKNALLYGVRAGEVQSSALLALPGVGLVAVGSGDGNRFFVKQPASAAHTYGRKLVLAEQPKSYTTADLFAPNVDRKENIEALKIDDASYDVVVCLHVLEHVNDKAAIAELYRIARPGGTLIAMFPIVEGWEETYENQSVSTEGERLLHFGQHDHARFFGRDARMRLAMPGFVVEEYTAVEPNVSRYGLMRGEKVFVCRRPPEDVLNSANVEEKLKAILQE